VNLLVAALAGAFLWTLGEYLLHRFVFHELPGSMLGAREHRMHHADPSWFAPWTQKAAAALVVTALLLPLAWLVAGGSAAAAFTGGFVGMYVAYEVLHRRIHTHPPRGPYGRWRRCNHFAHHTADPRRAHGVTSPLWDHVFGTTLPVAQVRVPRRLAMSWLLDDQGAVRPELARDYALIGGRAPRRPSAPARGSRNGVDDKTTRPSGMHPRLDGCGVPGRLLPSAGGSRSGPGPPQEASE